MQGSILTTTATTTTAPARVRTTTLPAPTRPTMHADALLKFDFSGKALAQKRKALEAEFDFGFAMEPAEDTAHVEPAPTRELTIKEAIIQWLDQQL